MGSYAERILSRAGGRDASPGDTIEAGLDRVVLSGAKAPSTLIRIRDRGAPRQPENVILTMDFQAPEVESEVPRSRALCRELSREYGLRHVFDLNHGVGSHVVWESGLVSPGHLVAGSGRCLGVLGGIGALAVRLASEELADSIVAGRLGLPVPETVRVALSGRPPRYLGAMDLAAAVAGTLGDRISGRVVELVGDIEHLGLDLRVSLCGLLGEMGALAAVVPPDETVVRFYRERGVTVEAATAEAPGDAVPVDLAGISAVRAGDYGGAASPVPAEGPEVQGVFVGGCYGGRYHDLALLAEVLKRKGQVHPDVRLAVSPATLETTRACLAAGFYETFLNAGAMVVVPGGGPGTAGGGAMFGEGEHIASTAAYHRDLHPGQGAPEVSVLGSAAAAVAAAEGRLIDPAVYLS